MEEIGVSSNEQLDLIGTRDRF